VHRCTKCLQDKSEGEFYYHRSKGKLVRNTRCRSCVLNAQRAWVEQNREHKNEFNRK
jgi:hypothetical protein